MFGKVHFLGKQATPDSFVEAASPNGGDETLAKVANKREMDAVDASKYGNLSAYQTSTILNKPRASAIPNYALLWESSQLISALLQRYPGRRPKPGEAFYNDLVTLKNIAIGGEQDLQQMAGSDKKSQTLKIFSDGYLKALSEGHCLNCSTVCEAKCVRLF
jgi:hypothetical protein